MSRARWLLLAVSCAAYTAPVLGQDAVRQRMPGEDGRWAFVYPGEVGRNGLGHIDTTRVVKLSNSSYRVWLRLTYTRPQQPLGFRKEIHRVDLDCAGNRLKLRQVILYDAEGGVLDEWSGTSPTWVDAVPDSMGDFVVVLGCAHIDKRFRPRPKG